MNTTRDPAPARRIPARAVQELCGGVSAMTIHRWLRAPELNFPAPVYIGNRRYWNEAEVLSWLDSRPTEGPEPRGAAA